MNPIAALMTFSSLTLVTAVAISTFGWAKGLAVGAAIWLLMPYERQ